MATIVPMIPTIPEPIHITQVANTQLQESIIHALDNTGYGQGYFMLDVDNKGGGVIVAHKFGDHKVDIELVAGGRYSFETGGEVRVQVIGKWGGGN